MVFTETYGLISDKIGIPVEAVIVMIIVLLVWKLVWYGLALYKAIEKKHKIWFVLLFIFTFVLNDLGIVAIIYLLMYRERKQKLKLHKPSKPVRPARKRKR